MTPASLIQILLRIVPPKYVMYVLIFMQGSYIVIDHFIYDLSPIESIVYIHAEHSDFLKRIEYIEGGIELLISNHCDKGG